VSARCRKCRGLLPPWLGDPQTAPCPNCGHVNAAGAALPEPEATPSPKATDAYATLNAEAEKVGLGATQMLPAAPVAPAGATKSAALNKTIALGAPPPSRSKLPSAGPQKRVPTLPQMPPPPPIAALPTPPPARALPNLAVDQAPGATPEGAGETDHDISIELETPPPVPSRTSLPSWVVPAGLEDIGSGAVEMRPGLGQLLRSRNGKLVAAGAGGLVVLILVLVAASGGKKPVSVTRPTPAPVTVVHAPVESPPAEVRAPAPRAPRVTPMATSHSVAAAAPHPAAPHANPPAHVASAPAHVASAPAPAPTTRARPAPAPAKPQPERQVMVASAPHVAAAAAAREPAHGSALASEDDQRRAREAYARGNSQLFGGHVDEAIASFKESLKLDPRNPAVQRGLGLAFVQAGNATMAVQCLKRYLKMSPAASDRALIEKRIEQLGGR
jgi:hypothetical protein